MSVHWGSCMATGEVATGEEVRSLSSVQLVSDSAMREREKGEKPGRGRADPFKDGRTFLRDTEAQLEWRPAFTNTVTSLPNCVTRSQEWCLQF